MANRESMTVVEIHERFFALIGEYAKRNLTPIYQTDDNRSLALGKMMATAFGWDGNAIMLAAAEALEDSNFHDDAAELRAKVPGA